MDWGILLWLGGAWLAFRGVHLLVLWQNAMKLRLEEPRLELAADADVPRHVREGLGPALAEVTALGFTGQGWVELTRTRNGQPRRSWNAWLVHPASGTHASVRFADVPEPGACFTTVFQTWYPDGSAVLTVNGLARFMVVDPPGTQVVDPLAADVAQQWHAHQDAVERHAGIPCTLDRAGRLAAEREDNRREFQHLRESGAATRAEDPGHHLLTARAALRLAWKVSRGQRAAQRQAEQRAKLHKQTRAPQVLAPVDEEVAAFARAEELARTPSRRHLYPWVFVATLVLFGLTLAHTIDAVATAWLVAVVLLHEVGHFGAMRALGYQDTTIFFIPFFGGAATGRKQDATRTQELVVLLAGPVPGMVLAALLLLLPEAPPWLRTGTWTLLAVNAFNLLPVMPLDGGRVVHGILFSRSKWGDAAFRVFAALALLAMAAWLHSGMLLLLALGALLAIPHGFRVAALRGRFPGAAGVAPDAARRFFTLLRETGRGALPFGTKVTLARSVLQSGQQGERYGCLMTLAWLAVYTGSIVFAAGTLAAAARVTAQQGPEMAQSVAYQAVLACPAPAVETGAAEGVEVVVAAVLPESMARVPLAGLGVFSGGTALVVRELGPLRWVGLRPPPGVAGGEDDQRASPALLEQASAVQAALEQQGAQAGVLDLVSGAGSSISLTWRAADLALARAQEQELAQYLEVPGTFHARPPWSPGAPVDDAVKRARRSYLLAERAARDGLVQQWRDTLPGGDQEETGSAVRRHVEEVEAQVTRAVEGAAAREPAVDREVVELFLQWEVQRIHSPEERREVQRRLAARLGPLQMVSTDRGEVLPAPGQLDLAVAGQVRRRGTELRLGFSVSSWEQLGVGLPALLGWVCAQGGTELRLRGGAAP